jgi:hypothetical protein
MMNDTMGGGMMWGYGPHMDRYHRCFGVGRGSAR